MLLDRLTQRETEKIMSVRPDHKVNVLLVDDHPENLLALEALLNNAAYNLVQAKSGEEALKCLLHQDFAVILLDVQMPGMDGFETATFIRARGRSRSTPIIFITAFSNNDAQVFKGYSLGAVDYLMKPIEAEILISKVAVFVELFQKTEEVKRQAEELRLVNAELSKSEERFRSLSASSPLGIYMADNDGCCTYMNQRCQTMCGFELQENLTEGWRRAVHPEDWDRVLAKWLGWIEAGEDYSCEFRLATSNGKTRWVHVHSAPMISDLGKPMGHVGTIRDITDRKLAEEERGRLLREQVARQEAERANRLKDEFLAILSHELRTPLNAILGWAKLLRTRKFDEKTTNKALETIERNAKCQAQLIEDILDVSRILRGKLQLNLRPVDVVSAIETIVESNRPAADLKSISLTFNYSPDARNVLGDGGRLQQVVWNLLSNAIKFTPVGGKVEVNLEAVGDWAQIQVTDTGIGISPEFLPFVFDRFRQADSTTTRSYGGLGLGLAIVRHLVELHGGTVKAQNNSDGAGAKFTVLLPLASGPGNRSTPELSQSSSQLEAGGSAIANLPTLTGLKVLVVDDDSDTCEFITAILEDRGAQVRTATSAAQALAAIADSVPNVLVSDIGMPEADGYELIAQVRSLEALWGETLPAVALTAYARLEEQQQALQAGFQMHLSKPVEPAELVAALVKLTKVSRPLNDRIGANPTSMIV